MPDTQEPRRIFVRGRHESVLDAIDQLREKYGLTNGETIGIFSYIAIGCIRAADADTRQDLIDELKQAAETLSVEDLLAVCDVPLFEN